MTIPRHVDNNKILSQQLPPHAFATPRHYHYSSKDFVRERKRKFSIVLENWTWRVVIWGCCSIFLKESWVPTELLIRYWENSRRATNKQSNESVSPFDSQLLVCVFRIFRGWGWVCGFSTIRNFNNFRFFLKQLTRQKDIPVDTSMILMQLPSNLSTTTIILSPKLIKFLLEMMTIWKSSIRIQKTFEEKSWTVLSDTTMTLS